MTQLSRVLLVASIGLLATCALAVPQSDKGLIISAANVDRVRPIAELERRVDRIVRVPGRSELVFLNWANSLEVVDDVRFRSVRNLAGGSRPIDFTISKDGRLQAWVEKNSSVVVLQDTATNKTTEINAGRSPYLMAFSPDNQLLAIGDTVVTPQDGHGGGYSLVRLWDTAGRLVRELEASPQGAQRPVFSPDGKILAVGNRNHEPRLFEVATGKLLHTLPRRMTQEIAFSPDGKVLAAGYVDGAVALWEVATGKMLHTQPSGAQEVYTLDWTAKGDLLVTAGRAGKIVLWDPRDLTKLRSLEAPDWVIQARFTADGTRLLTSGGSVLGGGNDRKVTVWVVAEGAGK